jgi:hypothetical protein
MYIFLVTFEEHFSWSGELNVRSVIKTVLKYSCITDGKKENMNQVKEDERGGECSMDGGEEEWI